MILNRKEAVSFLNMWMEDIRSVSIKKYDDVFELLINGQYLLTIKK